MDNYYTRLQLAPDASPAAIRKAYRRLAKTCHPDLHPDNDALAQKFIRLTEAYTVLSDPAARARYDEEIMPQPSMFPEGWPPRPQPFGKSHPKRRSHANHRKHEPLFRDEDLTALGMIVFAVLRSPITWCVVVAFLLLWGLGETVKTIGHPHKP